MMMFFPWKKLLGRKTFWFSILVMMSVGLVSIFAPRLAPHDPYKLSATYARLPSMWVKGEFVSGVPEFPLGTDRFGRDILSRLLYGTRTAFFLALTAVPLAALIGTFVGLVAGFSGGWLDAIITWLCDVIQSLPGIMFVVIVILIFRAFLDPTWINGLVTLVVGFAAVSWVGLARLIRVNVLILRNRLFIESAISLGASPWQVISRHLLPNLGHVVMVWIINNIPAVILLEAMLGYIGIGVTSAVDGSEFTVVSWGGIFFSGRSAMNNNPLMLIIPSVLILLISMSFILLGDILNGLTRYEPE